MMPTTWSTCVPPRVVAMPLTNETCRRPSPSALAAAATSHQPSVDSTRSYARGTASGPVAGPPRYRSM
jgi:hypothetical protein